MKFAKPIFLFCWISLQAHLATPSVLAQEFSEQRLELACTNLLLDPFSPEGLQTLAEVSRCATNSPALRSRAMAAYSLAYLMKGNTNAFDRALRTMQSTAPEAVALLKVTQSDCFSPCKDCSGSGTQITLCPTCMGSAKCKSCSGSGKKEAVPCPVCKGKGTCAMCSGKKRITTVCATCKGTTQIFNPKDTLRNNYNALLSDMTALCRENARFTEQCKLAAKETDLNKRIILLQDLLQAFPHRTDLGSALSMLEQTVNKRNTEESLRQATEKKEREEREKNELLRLRDVTNKELNGAIATLVVYLKEHPASSAYLELKVLSDELIARRKRVERTKKLLYGVLSLLGILIGASVLRPILFRKKIERFGPLPGMEKIDKRQFTDPLSLTAQASKARVKTKTAEIDPPDA
jgi:hypothetical protein